MQVSNSQDNIKELEAKIQALIFENKDLKTTNQSLSKKAEWLETELAISKHNCTLLKNAIYGKQSEKLKNSYTDQMSFLFNEAEIYVLCASYTSPLKTNLRQLYYWTLDKTIP